MKTVIGIVILAGVIGGIFYLNGLVRTEDGQSLLHVARELPIEVQTAQLQRQPITRTVQAPGEVEAFEEVDISSEVAGKLVELTIEEGDFVRAGDLLCRLDDTDFRARVLSAEANVAKLHAFITQAEADLEKAQRDWEQQQALRETDATSALELSNYRTALISAGANLEMRKQELRETEANLESAREYLEKTIITAPISGVVSQLFAEQGEVVITGTMNNPGTRIMVISDLSKMQVRCRVDEADAPLVAADQIARIYLQSDTRKSIPGSVLRVGTKGTKPVGRDVVTFETLVLITGDDPRVRPGMTANVEIEVARKDNALTVPVEAVVYRKRRDVPERLLAEYDRLHDSDEDARQAEAQYIKLIFCIEDEKAIPHLVETGINDVTNVEITTGIPADQTVVIGPYRSLDQLKDGSTVSLMKKPNDTAVAEKSKDQPTDDQNTPEQTETDETADADTSDESSANSTDSATLVEHAEAQ